MNDTTHTILIVEDEPEILELLDVIITAEGYATSRARNGVEALQLLEKQNFNAIISDVMMPEMNGYHLVLKVRETPATREIPFIFVSALTTLEEMLQGYALGGDDYIKKPIDADEVIVKLNTIIESKLKHLNLNQQLSDTQQAAMQAMSYSSYLGQVLQFMQNSLACEDFASLANEVFNTLEVLGLVSTLQFHTPEGIVSYAPDGQQVSPLESNIIEMARKQGRFFDFERRTLVNHDEFSLLLKNMPVDQPERYGLYKDILGNLCTAVEARVKFLISQKVADKRSAIMLSVDDIVLDIDKTFSEIQEQSMQAIETLSEDIEESFLSLGLTESQEDSIRQIIQNCLVKTDQAFEKGHALGEQIHSVHNQLYKNRR